MPSTITSGVTGSSPGWTGKNVSLPEEGQVSAIRPEDMDQILRLELMQKIVEQRFEIAKLRRELSVARLEARMAPLPAGNNKTLRAALASITWTDDIVEAKRLAEEALRS